MAPVQLQSWTTSATEIRIGADRAAVMLRRARRFAVRHGGRFDVRHDRTVILWSVERAPDGGRRAPIASFLIRFDADPLDAFVCRLAWDPEVCTVIEVYRAIDLLVGG
jgi:hypothetical protein